MNPYNELKMIKGVFESREKALKNGEPETRTYSESQYVAQVLRILNAYEKIISNGEFEVSVRNEMNDTIGVAGKKLKMAEIDNLLVIQSNTDNSYDMQGIADGLAELAKEDTLRGKDFMVIPKGAVALTAKIKLEEDEEDVLWA